MEMEAGSTSGSGGGASSSRPFSPMRSRALYKFTQQNLPAWKPVLTPGCVIMTFLLMGVVSIPVGLFCLRASESVVEIAQRYDIDCIPKPYRSNKVAYIRDSSISKNCTLKIKVMNHMKAPIFIYYELDNYYQNHRRYVKSKNDKQLRHGLAYKNTGSCKPVESSHGPPVVPCGLIAWSLFNDSYNFVRETVGMKVNRKNISWKSDREHKFGKNVYPFNFQNGTLIGGGKLDPKIPLNEQEDLIVWMRAAALPKFRKLYGVIEEDLEADEVITVYITNNYNTYSFGGKKRLVLTTSSWLGGKNHFLGIAYIITGSSCILTSILFALIHGKNPRPQGDAAYLSWNRKNSAS
ncbi:putative ALA-interacting subunit 2 [Typha latifolia]|uniref:putative ALA-interacting subunit 2 n=1 Tax=Typha latifolia TaxID=4733 RepID=UPI003C2B6B15